MALISQSQHESFASDGFLLLPGFYDTRLEIEPVKRAIHSIIGLVIQRHRLEIR